MRHDFLRQHFHNVRRIIALAAAPMECAVGCSTCGNICPTNAISFPTLDAVWKLEREKQIFKTVKKEALHKHEREDTLKAREAAQKAVAQVPTRARVEVAGEFGDKRFLVRLEELIENKPFDVVEAAARGSHREGSQAEGAFLHELRGHLGAAGGHHPVP